MAVLNTNEYYSDGSAARKIETYGGLNVVRETEYVHQPARKPKPETQVVRAHSRVPVSSLMGFAVVTVLLFLVVFSYVRLFEVSSESADLQAQLEAVNEKNNKMSAEYEKVLDLNQVKLVATSQCGMKQADKSQIVYISLGNSDKAEIVKSETGGLKKVISAFLDSIEYIKDYFS